MKILICGLPGSGKTTLAKPLAKLLDAELLNADEVRTQNNDWDFSEDGRVRQAQRMRELADAIVEAGRMVIADFICPTEVTRKKFDADFTIHMNTINAGRYEDTNDMFERPSMCNFIVSEWRNDTPKVLDSIIKKTIVGKQWSVFSNPDIYSGWNGEQCPYAIKNNDGNIIGFDTYDNDYLSRSEINEETLSKKHILFLGDSFVFGHGVKRKDDIAFQFKNNNTLPKDYSCFNLGLPGGSNMLSLTRLHQWCNVHSEKLHTVYFGITDLARTTHWQASAEWTWDDNMYTYENRERRFKRFDYIPANPTQEKIDTLYAKLTSKINYLVNFEIFLMSVINLSKIHKFNVFLFETIPGILTREELNIIINNISMYKNIRWTTQNDNVGEILGEGNTEEFLPTRIPNDNHWNTLGTKIISENMYKETFFWYLEDAKDRYIK